MRRWKIFWQLFLLILTITFVAVLATTWSLSGQVKRFYLEQVEQMLVARAVLFQMLIPDAEALADPPAVDALCKRLGRRLSTRFTVVADDGRVLGDSESDPAVMDNHRDRPEVRAALREGLGRQVRYSDTRKREMMYVAQAIRRSGETIAVVRTSVPLTAIAETLSPLMARQINIGLVVLLLGAGFSLWVARRISGPVEELTRSAEAFARGDLTRKVRLESSTEIDALAEAMNAMARQLSERLRSVVEAGNEKQAILSGMVEGVLAVDLEERVLLMNQAARRLLGVSDEPVEGLFIQEVIRHPGLARFARETLDGQKPVATAEFSLGDRHLQAHGTLLRDMEERAVGAVIVLNDVTELRRLENLRRDFVANVSHEIKTPVTSIKLAVETLSGGAMASERDRERFLQVIQRHTDRLETLIEDLLRLSRLEQEEERSGIELTKTRLRPVLEAAQRFVEFQARAGEVRLELDCPEDIEARLHPLLIEQAVVNLLDNAVKHSPAGGTVRLSAAVENGEVVIRVQDQGPGIDPAHHARLFERFYRVDKARSRQEGGTGLGLAIVKHIVQVHRGRVGVDSAPGQGSIFRLHLPTAKRA